MANILIVEDNAELADNLVEILRASGHRADWIETAEDALERLKESKYCGILTDLRLPKMSGLQLLENLRRGHDTTPVVLMTAFANAEATEQAESLGALAVLFKPLDCEKLSSLVSEFSPA